MSHDAMRLLASVEERGRSWPAAWRRHALERLWALGVAAAPCGCTDAHRFAVGDRVLRDEELARAADARCGFCAGSGWMRRTALEGNR